VVKSLHKCFKICYVHYVVKIITRLVLKTYSNCWKGFLNNFRATVNNVAQLNCLGQTRDTLKEEFTFEKTFADNLLTPMSSKMSMSFFLQLKRNEGF